ncbi:cation diffusion facilitator family transporter [Candidatus Saccharibacteria bacterium]|nr:cation diffusion facilitator family transporter [Candidatus Saccharibacteria bacterium]
MEKSRSKIIVRSGYYFILTNFLLGAFNIAVGLLSNSIAIISDAAHSFIDAVSGLLVVVSEKLSNHKKYSEKREEIERITTILIALIIIIAGIHIIVEAIEKIITPDDVDYSLPVMIVLVASILAKYVLAFYLSRTGKRVKSKVLMASGAETMNDTLISVAVLISAIIYLIWQVDIEAYVSLAISIIIIKVGLEFIFPKISHHHHHHLESNPDHIHH